MQDANRDPERWALVRAWAPVIHRMKAVRNRGGYLMACVKRGDMPQWQKEQPRPQPVAMATAEERRAKYLAPLEAAGYFEDELGEANADDAAGFLQPVVGAVQDGVARQSAAGEPVGCFSGGEVDGGQARLIADAALVQVATPIHDTDQGSVGGYALAPVVVGKGELQRDQPVTDGQRIARRDQGGIYDAVHSELPRAGHRRERRLRNGYQDGGRRRRGRHDDDVGRLGRSDGGCRRGRGSTTDQRKGGQRDGEQAHPPLLYANLTDTLSYSRARLDAHNDACYNRPTLTARNTPVWRSPPSLEHMCYTGGITPWPALPTAQEASGSWVAVTPPHRIPPRMQTRSRLLTSPHASPVTASGARCAT